MVRLLMFALCVPVALSPIGCAAIQDVLGTESGAVHAESHVARLEAQLSAMEASLDASDEEIAELRGELAEARVDATEKRAEADDAKETLESQAAPFKAIASTSPIGAGLWNILYPAGVAALVIYQRVRAAA